MTYPTVFMPGNPEPASWNIRSNRKTLTSDSLSMRRQTRVVGGQRYELDLSYNPMHRDQVQDLIDFLEDQQGRHGTFGVVLPPLNSAQTYAHAETHTKSYRVRSGGATITELATSYNSSTRETNTFVVENAVSYIACVRVSNAGASTVRLVRNSDDAVVSNSVQLQDGYNAVMLTTTSGTTAYLSITGSCEVLETSCRRSQASSGLHLSPAAIQADDLLPGLYPVFTCSLDDDVVEVRYGKDGFIKLTVPLIERL